MTTDTVPFGIIGCGTIAPTHADALAGIKKARLVACCDLVQEKAESFARTFDIPKSKTYTSLQSFLSDNSIEAVSVCTPSGSHSDVGVQALRSGKHVIVEKPMDVSLAACDALIAAQQETGKVLAVVSQHRFDPASLYVRSLVENKTLGNLFLAEAHIKWYRTQEYYDSGDWRGTWEMDGGGALMNQGVHTVDLLRWTMGPVTSVYAVARTAAHQRIEVEDVICATLQFENGGVGTIVASTAAYPGFPASLSLHGSNGSAILSGDALHSLDLIEGTPPTDQHVSVTSTVLHAMQIAQGGTKSAESNKPKETLEADPAAIWGFAHQRQLEDFVQAIESGSRPAVDGIAGRQAVEIITAVYESARTGKVIPFS